MVSIYFIPSSKHWGLQISFLQLTVAPYEGTKAPPLQWKKTRLREARDKPQACTGLSFSEPIILPLVVYAA